MENRLKEIAIRLKAEAERETYTAMWKWYEADLTAEGISREEWDDFAEELRDDWYVICVEIDSDGIFIAFDDEVCPKYGMDEGDEE